MSSNKINDLLEDLQDTLDNSILNKSESKENKTVSELFDTLNKSAKDGSEDFNDFEDFGSEDIDVQNDNNTQLKISKAIPTPSVFDEALRSQNKFKNISKSAHSSGSLSDTKEVPINLNANINEKNSLGSQSSFEKMKTEKSRRSPLESFLTNMEKEETEDEDIGKIKETPKAENIIHHETISESNGQSYIGKIETETADYEIDEIEEIENDDSDMNMELLKAIGIGKTEENSKSAKNVSGRTAEKENKIRKGTLASPIKPPKHFYKIINKEYVNHEQVNEIFSSYQKAYMSEFIKLVLGSFFFLILFYMETAPYLNWKLPNILNINYYNVPYIWIDLQILLLVAALNSKSLILGVKSFFSSNINVYSMGFFFFALAFIQTMLTLYLRYNHPDIVMYNAIAAYCIVLISIYNLLDMNAEITSFKTVSAKKPKYALSFSGSPRYNQFNQPNNPALNPPPYRSAHLESELFKDTIPHEAVVGGVLKTPFISNFFSRTYKEKNAGGFIKYFIYISLLGALALFVFSIGFTGNAEKDWYASLSAVTALLLGSVPLCSFIIEVYPVYRAQKKARAIGSAFIGGKSLEESAETAIISLYDKDIFPAEQIKISGIKVYGNNRIDTVLQNLCIVFEKLNMPPADTFKSSTNFEKNFNKNIKIISIDDYGICYLANNIKLFLGNPEYISNIGLVPSYDHNFDDPFIKSSGSIMFLASETEVIAKVYLKYEITADFNDIIKNIKKLNACLCIRTFDPNIDDALIAKLGNTKKYPVRVLKLKDFTNVHTTPERMDSPVVSKDSIKSLINAILIAGKTRTVMKSNVLIQTAAFVMSIALALVLGFMGHLGGINSGHLFLLQTFWMLPVIILLGITA